MFSKSLPNVSVVIGRFRMLTLGHDYLLREAARGADHLIVLVGSVNRRTSDRNPYNYRQVRDYLMIWAEQNRINITVLPLRDHLYVEAAWEAEVQALVNMACKSVFGGIGALNITLFGHDKDSTTYYTKSFPQWHAHDVGLGPIIDATTVRHMWFSEGQQLTAEVARCIPDAMQLFLLHWEFNANLQADFEYYRNERIKFKDYPYLETLNFLCGDAVIECAGHVLTVERAHAPGKNCRALPGGFKNQGETLQTTGIREGFEETNLRVSERTIRKSIVGGALFDAPGRSNGIPRITWATHIKIDPNPDGTLPRANGKTTGEGSGEVVSTEWTPVSTILQPTPVGQWDEDALIMYDDHTDIVESLVNAAKRK